MPRRIVRESKFRHVFGEPFKKEQCFDGIPITKNAWDSSYCAVNSKFVAVVLESRGGGAFVVLPLHKTGKIDFDQPKVTGHRNRVLDIQWNPFNDNLIASASEDCTVKIWNIPDDGLNKDLLEPAVDLHGHQRKVGIVQWHPVAYNILASAGFDHSIIIWNVAKAEPVKVLSGHNDTIYCMVWNREGNLLGTTSKDKKIRILDPRKNEVVQEGKGHEGPKSSRICFLGNDCILTTGFSKFSEREFAIWNQNDLSNPLKSEGIDSSSGILFPFYDQDTNIIYLAGKGDGNIRYYELTDSPPFIHYLNEYRSNSPQRGLGVIPKRSVDVNTCEVFRFYKLHQTGLCEPISMIVPRKSDLFQEDLYPLTQGDMSSLEADEWLEGKDAEPILISLRDGFTPTEKIFIAPIKPKEETSVELTPQLEAPRNEKDLRKAFYEQQDEIRRLKELIQGKDLQIHQLENQLLEANR